MTFREKLQWLEAAQKVIPRHARALASSQRMEASSLMWNAMKFARG
jgi:hypothetical protein